MSGHSHWAGIKHKKEITDQKRGKVFSKLLRAITVAAKSEPNPDFNPRLRTAVSKARLHQVSADSIKRAIEKASTADASLEEVTIECYGPGGVAVIADAVTDNKNRTVAEVKKIVGDFGGKWAEPGAVRWAFEVPPEGGWRAKFPIDVNNGDIERLLALVAALEDYDDIELVATNSAET